jgi:type I restriction enzyme S subunit
MKRNNWEIVKLKEIAVIIMGQSPKSEFYNTNREGLPFFQGCSEFGALRPVPKKWCTKPLKIAYKDDILMSVRAPVGALNIADRKCIVGRGLCAIRTKLNRNSVHFT